MHQATVEDKGLRLRPDREFWLALLSIGLIGMAALMYAANAVWLIVSLIFAAVGGATAATSRRLRGIQVDIPQVLPVLHAGATNVLSIRVECLVDQHDLWIDAGGVAVHVPHVAAGTHLLTAPLPDFSRGLHPCPRVRIYSGAPFGIIRCLRQWHVNYTIPVAPAPALKSDHDPSNAAGPEHLNPAGHRPYRLGDPIAALDWRAAARGQGWLIAERDGGTHVQEPILDYSDYPGPREERLCQLCTAVLDHSHRNHRFGLRLPGVNLPPNQGESHRQACLRALAACPKE